jgi:hypothetical protein
LNKKEEFEKFENIYGNILRNIHGVAKEALGYQEKRKNNKLWTGEIDQLVKEKKILYVKQLNFTSEEDKRNYIRKKNEVRRIINSEKIKYGTENEYR